MVASIEWKHFFLLSVIASGRLVYDIVCLCLCVLRQNAYIIRGIHLNVGSFWELPKIKNRKSVMRGVEWSPSFVYPWRVMYLQNKHSDTVWIYFIAVNNARTICWGLVDYRTRWRINGVLVMGGLGVVERELYSIILWMGEWWKPNRTLSS